MRIALAAAAALVLSAACGKDTTATPPSQSTGPAQQFVVAVNTQGDGLVRGLTTDCRGACTQRYDAGSSVTLRAMADAGATFDGWTGACSGTGDCTLSVSGDMTVTAAFGHHQTPQHQLTVLVDGHGSVRSSPAGIDCGATCAAPFDQGTAVTLTAAPDSGWQITGFSGACSGAAACSLTMNADALVRVKFDAIPPPPPPAMVNLTVTVNGQGTVTGAGINCPGTCSAQVQAGTPVTLTATAASGARFMGFSGACTGATCAFAANANSAVSAKFEQEVMTLAPADGTNSNYFAINSTQVFFQRYGNSIYGIWSVPKVGGTETMVSSYCCAQAMVADDSFVYWSDYSGILRASVGGGAAQRIVNMYASILTLVLDGGQIYWTAYSGYNSSNSGVYSAPAAGGAMIQLSGGNPTGGLAVDSQYAYWTDYSHSVMRVPKAGGVPDAPISCGGCVPVVVRVDFDNIYYRNQDGDTWARAKTGGDFHQLNTGNPRNQTVFRVDMDVNAKVVYFNWDDGVGTDLQGLFRANADGTGWAPIETSSDQNWWGPRVDDNYIFYMHAGALYRRLK